jgi:hypothetical protein
MKTKKTANRKLKIKENSVIKHARKFLDRQISLSDLQKAYADYESVKEKASLK